MKIYSAFRVSFRAARNNLHAHRDPIKMDYLCVFSLPPLRLKGGEREGEINRKRRIQLFSWPSKRVWYCAFNIPVNTGEIWFRVYPKLRGIIDFWDLCHPPPYYFAVWTMTNDDFYDERNYCCSCKVCERKERDYFLRPFFFLSFFFLLLFTSWFGISINFCTHY